MIHLLSIVHGAEEASTVPIAGRLQPPGIPGNPLAPQFPLTTALWVAWPMRMVTLVFYSAIAALNAISNGLLRLVGVRRTGGAERYRSVDEISQIVAESGREGALASEPSEVTQELLAFGDLTAAEVMVPRTRMVTLPLGADRRLVASVLAAEPHTRYPVVDGGPEAMITPLAARCTECGPPRSRPRRGRASGSPPRSGDGGFRRCA